MPERTGSRGVGKQEFMTIKTAKNQKLFSIIMATYNCGQKVEDTLQSIFSQNAELFEVIVVDNVSTDGTLQILEKYADRLTLISEKDDGIYYAFNKAINLATGKYLYFIGAGDTLKSNILERIKPFMAEDEPALIYGRCYLMKSKKENGREFTDLRFFHDCLCQQGIFYHRQVFEIIGNYDLKYKVFADWLFNLRCFRSDKIKKQYLDLVIANYEEGGISSKIGNDPAFKKDFPVIVGKEFGFFYYLLCWLFLRETYLFNYIYERKIKYLPEYFISNYALPGYLAGILRRYIRRWRTRKKLLTDKTADYESKLS